MIYDFLWSQTWTCQWRCPYRGEVNRVRKQDLPLDIESPAELPQHLICHGCHMSLGEVLLIYVMVHPTCPVRIPQRKRFTLHFWPDEPYVIGGSTERPLDGSSLTEAS